MTLFSDLKHTSIILAVGLVAFILLMNSYSNGLLGTADNDPLSRLPERLTITKVTVEEGFDSYIIILTVENTGGWETNIQEVLVNGLPPSQYTNPAMNATLAPSTGTMAVAETGTLSVGINTHNVASFAPDGSLEITIRTTGGRDYSQKVSLA